MSLWPKSSTISAILAPDAHLLRHCRNYFHPGYPTGCVRDRGAPAAGTPKLSDYFLVLPAHVDSLAKTREPYSRPGPPGKFPRLLRASVVDFPAGFVGCGADLWFRLAAIRSGRAFSPE